MSIIRTEHNKNNPYVLLNKTALEDEKLSWAAKGLWSYLMSRPDNWNVSVAHLSSIYKDYGGGEKAIYSLLNELIENGYCQRKQDRSEKGKFNSYEYIISEFKIISPQLHSRDAVPPRADPPDAVNRHINNNDYITSKEDNNKEQQQQAPSALSAVVGEKQDFGEIKYKTPLGKEKSISESDVYLHFVSLPYSTETLKKAIVTVRSKQEPIGNILKLLESICITIDSNPSKTVKFNKNNTRNYESPNAPPKCTEKNMTWAEAMESLKKEKIKQG